LSSSLLLLFLFFAVIYIISDIVHEFLITLLTSHRYGVVFHDRTLGGSRSKHNQLVHTVLQNLEKPWEHEKPSDLIVRIMGACPDLIRSQYNAIESFLEPRMSPKWICLLKFIGKVREILVHYIFIYSYIVLCTLFGLSNFFFTDSEISRPD